MDLDQLIAELQRQRQWVNGAILCLSNVNTSRNGKRRGRPPKWMAEETAEKPLESSQSDQQLKRAAKKSMPAI